MRATSVAGATKASPPLTFDPLKDLLPVASVATNQFMLSVHPDVPAKTFPEFIDYARRTKPALPYASGGNGSQHQLSMEILKQRGIERLTLAQGLQAEEAHAFLEALASNKPIISTPHIIVGRASLVMARTRSRSRP